MADGTATTPAAGVIATRPATTSVTVAKVVGLPLTFHSSNAQLKPAAAAAMWVVTKAWGARAPAPKALPALKPNHPNQRRAAPRTTKGRLCKGVGVFSYPLLLPITKVATRPATPALICKI